MWIPSTTSFAPPLYQPAPSAAAAPFASDSVVPNGVKEQNEAQMHLDSEAIISIETKPSNARVRIDGKLMEEKTPCVASQLSSGKHTVTASIDSLQASKTVLLKKGELKRLNLTLEKPKTTRTARVKKKGRGIALSISALSVAFFAGSGVSYYLYRKDHRNQLKTFNYLNNSTVKGPDVEDKIAQNRDQHADTQMKLNISQVLFGTGALLLGTGIILSF